MSHCKASEKDKEAGKEPHAQGRLNETVGTYYDYD